MERRLSEAANGSTSRSENCRTLWPFRSLAGFGSPASPTFATAICLKAIGRDETASNTWATRESPCLFRKAWSARPSAATTGKRVGDFRDRALGDGIVPLISALGVHKDPKFTLSFPVDRRWVGYEMNYLELLDRQEVYQQIRGWVRTGSDLPCAYPV